MPQFLGRRLPDAEIKDRDEINYHETQWHNDPLMVPGKKAPLPLQYRNSGANVTETPTKLDTMK